MNTILNKVIIYVAKKIIKCSTVPKHIVFIADGARRFGRKHNIPVQENHEIGLHNVMWQIIEYCCQLNIREYSILMYTLGNYNRPEKETGHWIDVFRIWLKKCIVNWRILKEKGIRFDFYGMFELSSEDLNGLMATLSLITINNENVIVHVAMGYTGKHEMSAVAFDLVEGFQSGSISVEDINVELFKECTFAKWKEEPDLFIRTSGYCRISDFMTYQIATTKILFIDVLWPEFDLLQLLKSVFYFQHFKQVMNGNAGITSPKAASFMNSLKSKRFHRLIHHGINLKMLDYDDLKVPNHIKIYNKFCSWCTVSNTFF